MTTLFGISGLRMSISAVNARLRSELYSAISPTLAPAFAR
jgi:hypothetical protein